MKKRMLAALLALVMLMGALSVTAVAKGAAAYQDVSADDWFYGAVGFVTENGLMTGTHTGFEPQRTTSRAMLWTILSRLDGQSAKRNAADWYAAAQLWAVQNDISDGTAPDAPITREQLASMLYRYAQRRGLVRAASSADLSTFADAAAVSAYAEEAVQWAVETGLLNGMGGMLCPQGAATRAQVAEILRRMCEKWDILTQDNAAVAAAAWLYDDPEHTHSWTYTANKDGTHTATCTCGETKTEYCGFPAQNGTVTCPTCGFTTDHGVNSYEKLTEAIADHVEEIFITDDIEVEKLIEINEGTAIYGGGHKFTIADGITLPRMLEASGCALMLKYLTLDGENNECSDYQGVVNAKEGSILTLEKVVIQNFKAYRILRTLSAAEINLTDLTIKDNVLTSDNTRDESCVMLLNSTPKAVMKNVTVTGNQTDRHLLYLVGSTNLEAEGLIMEENTVKKHLVVTASTSAANMYTFTSGSIKNNEAGEAGFFVVGNITIGEAMTVACDITINNTGSKDVCTLTNNGTIIGDIRTAFPSRGLPNYTGSGKHTGNNEINVLTAE